MTELPSLEGHGLERKGQGVEVGRRRHGALKQFCPQAVRVSIVQPPLLG